MRQEPLRSGEVSGVLHRGDAECVRALVLTHGAGGNMNSAVLVAMAEEFAAHDVMVLRCDLPFRQSRPHGPPRPGDAARDREGLASALEELRRRGCSEVHLGGQSYGGRQASMLAAERPDAAGGLLLLSYPLHPPGKPGQLRTQHFGQLRVPVLFVEGTRDPFGTVEEMEAAARLIPSATAILTAVGVGHDLGFSGKKRKVEDLPARTYEAFTKLLGR